MDFVLIKEFFSCFSLPTLLVAVIVSAISLLCDKFVSDKLSITIRHYASFALSVIFYYLYDAIFVLKSFDFTTATLYSGVLSGSLSAIITSLCTRIIKGKSIRVSPTALLIERLIKDLVCEDQLCQVVSMIENILLTCEDEKNSTEQVKNLLTKSANNTTDKSQIDDITVLIINSVNSIKNEKR